MAMIADLIPRFSRLRCIVLNSDLVREDYAITQKIIQDYVDREEPVRVLFIICEFILVLIICRYVYGVPYKTIIAQHSFKIVFSVKFL